MSDSLGCDVSGWAESTGPRPVATGGRLLVPDHAVAMLASDHAEQTQADRLVTFDRAFTKASSTSNLLFTILA
jgi:hypothetical protein